MSKRIAYLTAAAFSALAITATVVAPVRAEEKTVMVGGAAMFPSKNIVQNAVNSKDHTTLVAAVKAAGLVPTLEGKGPFTVFAPTNAAFGKLPAGTVDTLVKPESKATLTKILTYHVVAGKLEASDLTDGKKTQDGRRRRADRQEVRRHGHDRRCQGRVFDRHHPQRQPVQRRDPCRRHRADAGDVRPRGPASSPNRMRRNGEPGVPGSLYCDHDSPPVSIRCRTGRNESGRIGV